MSPHPDLAKAVRPEDFTRIGKKTLHEAGPFNVDHKPELMAHPQEAAGATEWYRAHVLGGDKVAKPLKGTRKAAEGITAKLRYAGPPGSDTTFMVKPYHENIEKKVKWQHMPIQGWAEMTNQALFHAAGIGDLHQHVHVDEHPTPNPAEAKRISASNAIRKDPYYYDRLPESHRAALAPEGASAVQQQPALVIHMKPNQKSAWGLYTDAEPGEKEKAHAHPEDVARIGIMDFLSNNLDRHGGNLLFDMDSGKPLAVDHSRNFQYTLTHKMKRAGMGRRELANFNHGREEFEVPSREFGRRKFDRYDRFVDYLDQGALAPYNSMRSRIGGPDSYKNQMKILEEMKPHIEEWWPKVRDNVVKTMDERLKQIKNPDDAAHIRRNFHARVRWLDDRAHNGLENFGADWYNDPVNWYPPGLHKNFLPQEGEE